MRSASKIRPACDEANRAARFAAAWLVLGSVLRALFPGAQTAEVLTPMLMLEGVCVGFEVGEFMRAFQ